MHDADHGQQIDTKLFVFDYACVPTMIRFVFAFVSIS